MNKNNNKKNKNQDTNKIDFYHGESSPFFQDKNSLIFHHTPSIIETFDLEYKIRYDIDWSFFSCADDSYESENKRVLITDLRDTTNSWDGINKPLIKKYKDRFFYNFDSSTFLKNNIEVGNKWSFVFVLTTDESYNSYLLTPENENHSVICGWAKKGVEWYGKKRLYINSNNYEAKLIIGIISDENVTLITQEEKVSNNGEIAHNKIILSCLGAKDNGKNQYCGKIAVIGILNRELTMTEIQFLKKWHKKNYF